MSDRSYDHCGSEKDLLGETIGQCLDRIAAIHPDNEFLVSIPQGLRFTYAEFVRIVNRAAKAFLNLGIRRGDRVAIWSINNYEWVVTQFATARLRAVTSLAVTSRSPMRHQLTVAPPPTARERMTWPFLRWAAMCP